MFKRFRDDMKKYWKYAVYSSKAQLKSEIANSYLNWLWWVLDPICFMLIYPLIFGVVFNAKEQYFTIFIFKLLSLSQLKQPPQRRAIQSIAHVGLLVGERISSLLKYWFCED